MKTSWFGSRLSKSIRFLCVSLLLLSVFSGLSWGSTTVSGRIDTDTTWDLTGSPYIVTSTIQVYGDTTTVATLTIEPGVEVRFNSGVSMQIGNGANKGALIASGTSGSPITFTRDAASGYWGQLTFNDGTDDATTLIEYVNLDYNGGVYFYTASPYLKDCTVQNISNATYGFYLSASNPTLENVDISTSSTYGMYLTNSSPTISGGSLTNSHATGHGIYGGNATSVNNYTISIVDTVGKYGFYVTTGTSDLSVTNSTIGNGFYLNTINITPTITGNTFTNGDTSPIRIGANIVGDVVGSNTFSGLTSAGKVEIVGEQIKNDATWLDLAAPYEVVSGDILIYKDTVAKSTLTLNPGVEIRFASSSNIQVGSSTQKGALIAQGTVGNHITFTRKAATGTFPQTYFYNGADDATTILEYVDIDYSKGLYMVSASPTIRDCTLTNVSGYYGIYLSTSNPTLENVDLSVAYSYGLYMSNSSPIITGGSLVNTQANSHGVYGSGSPVISNYDVQIVDSTNKYGVYLTSTTSSFSLTNSTIQNSIYLSSTGISPTITGNTFSRGDSSPIHMGANILDNVLANNTFLGLTSAGKIEIVGEKIDHDVTWTKMVAPYVVSGTVYVYKSSTEASTLTINPGVEIQFSSNGLLQVGYSSSKGIIKAQGTLAEPITMTRSGVSGGWSGIYFNDKSDDVANVFEYVNMTYSNGIRFYTANPTLKNVSVTGGTSYGLYLSSASPVLENVMVSTNYTYAAYLSNSSPQFQGGSITNLKVGGHGIYGISSCSPAIANMTITIEDSPGIYSINLPTTTSALSITNSTINNSLYISSTNIQPTITGNTFGGLDLSPLHIGASLAGDLVSSNTLTELTSAGRVELVGEYIKQNMTLKKLIAPYVITSNITVYNSSTPTPAPVLTIEAGAQLKFNQNRSLTIGHSSYPGLLDVQGTAAEPVVFTANHASPIPGFWAGIALNSSSGYDSSIEHAIIEYAGSGSSYSNAGLVVLYSGPIIRNVTIRDTKNTGIYLSSASGSPQIDSCNIAGMTWGIYSLNSNPEVFNCKFYNNSTAAIWNASAAALTARGNWWGDATGPTHADNVNGIGDVVTDNVVYNPWLSAQPNADLSLTRPSVSPDALNPDGGLVTFAGTLSQSANWTIVVKDDVGGTVKTMTGSGLLIDQAWTGDTDQGGSVGTGWYTYSIDATDSGYNAATVYGLLEATSDFTAVIATPTDGQMYLPFVQGSTYDIIGSADAISSYQNYTIEYGVGETPVQWITLTTSTQTVNNDILYSWTVPDLTEDIYSIRLTVHDSQGGAAVRVSKIRFLRVKSTSQSENYISPNSDAVQDAVQVDATYSYSVDWTMTVKDDQLSTVRTYNGSGSVISQTWDGMDGLSQIVADGTYSYQLDVTSTETGLIGSSVSGNVVVDTIAPTATITTPILDAVVHNDVLLTGTADDVNFDSFRVEVEPASGGATVVVVDSPTAVVANDLATWVTNDNSGVIPYVNDDYLLWLIATDKAGNNSSVIRPVTLNNLQFSNVTATSHAIDTRQSETSTIGFDINAPAFVTFKVIPELQGASGTPVFTDTQNCATAGSYSFLWDGTDDSAQVVADEAYIYVLEGDDGTAVDIYAPDSPAGGATVSCNDESSYAPYKNDPLTITYSADLPCRFDINMLWGPQNFKIADSIPVLTGEGSFEWDGRNLNGDLLDEGAESNCTFVSRLPENHILTSGDTPEIAFVRTDPYSLDLGFGQFSRIQYELSHQSIVTVSLVSPSGTTETLVNGVTENPGTHEVVWDAILTTDPMELQRVVAEEGWYEVRVSAVNPVTGSQIIKKANLVVRY